MKTGSTVWNKRAAAYGLMAAGGALAVVSVGVRAAAAATDSAAVAAVRVAAPRQTSMTTNSVRVTETEAGNLVADAVRVAGSADIGLVPAAAFRPSASVVRPANGDQAAELVDPSSDDVLVLSLRGDQIMAALERSVSFAPQPSAGFLQVSGLRFSFDTHKEGGKRVTAVTVGGQTLDASKTYKVATTKPLAHGQQGYFQIWAKGDISTDPKKTLAVALSEYIKGKGGTVSPVIDGRINQTDK